VGAVAVDHFSLRHYPLYGFTGPRLRDNAILVALLMEELAAPAGGDPAAAYAAGLFRSTGKLALARIADENAPVVIPFQPTEIESLVSWERRQFGLTSNHATAAILAEWHFHGDVTRAIDQHYTPAADGQPLAGLLNLAARLAEQLGHGLPGEAPNWLDAAGAVRTCGLTPRQIERAIERSVVAFDRINRALV